MNNDVLPVQETLSEAWSKVHGAKASIWAALGILIAISFALGVIEGLTNWKAMSFVAQFVGFLIQAGIVYIGIKRAQDEPISFRLMWRAFEGYMIARIVGLYLVELLIFLPLIFLGVIAGFTWESNTVLAILMLLATLGVALYLGLSILLATAYVLDKEYGPIQAIKLSFKATRKHLVNILAISLIEIVIVVVAAIPLGIGLIWAIPFCLNCYGVMYRRLSQQVEQESLVSP